MTHARLIPTSLGVGVPQRSGPHGVWTICICWLVLGENHTYTPTHIHTHDYTFMFCHPLSIRKIGITSFALFFLEKFIFAKKSCHSSGNSSPATIKHVHTHTHTHKRGEIQRGEKSKIFFVRIGFRVSVLKFQGLGHKPGSTTVTWVFFKICRMLKFMRWKK